MHYPCEASASTALKGKNFKGSTAQSRVAKLPQAGILAEGIVIKGICIPFVGHASILTLESRIILYRLGYIAVPAERGQLS